MAERGGVGTRLYVAGGTEVRREFDQTGDAGKRMFAQIAAGERSANPALRALSAGVGEVKGGITGLADQAGGVGRALGAAGAAGLVFGAAIAGVGIALQAARESMAFFDEIGDAATKTGVTTDTLQELRYMIHAAGGEFTDADAALVSFTQKLGDAENGAKKSLLWFQKLGFTQEQLKAFGSVDEAMKAVADRIAGLDKEADKQAFAQKLGLEKLLPALRLGADGMDELRRAAHDLGYVMDEDVIAKVGEANDKFEASAAIVKGQFAAAFVQLVPILVEVMQTMADLARQTNNFFDGFKKLEDRQRQSMVDRRGHLLEVMTKAQFGQLAGTSHGRNVADRARTEYDALGVELAYRDAQPDLPTFNGPSFTPQAGGSSKAGKAKDNRSSLDLYNTPPGLVSDPNDPRAGQDWSLIPDTKTVTIDIDPERGFQKLNEKIDESTERLHDGVYDALHAAFSGDIGDFIKNKLMSWALEGLTSTLMGGLQSAGSRGGLLGTIANAAIGAFGGSGSVGGGGGGKSGLTANGLHTIKVNPLARYAAGGTEWAGDYTSKGEFGPELSISGRTGQVFDADTTARILGMAGGQVGGGRGGHTINFSPTINAPGADRQAIAELRAEMRQMAAGIPDVIDQRAGPAAHDYLQRGHVLPQSY